MPELSNDKPHPYFQFSLDSPERKGRSLKAIDTEIKKCKREIENNGVELKRLADKMKKLLAEKREKGKKKKK
ncbi:MAG: hypothetical protein A2754_03985 [Candidatus Magasanikbacteria bacterium RIFCSPHIGHO2_01_FULL_47_8]|uniref:Uncharacterized protein n=1 Tax=Candidatus Magasanikbacteria bacterium RIFCSPHIGHO2_01_FULL_47_8 TaxID=1798673 RepID=A0A1F6ME53_9BACT|nr:MAG: hypothetical protein A2754_03985 [Candidatus Magasanikbacteria bacterium RIFCSPHIGHO2_01_FULL_47_8]